MLVFDCVALQFEEGISGLFHEARPLGLTRTMNQTIELSSIIDI
jgi:hypothetical protein